MNNATSSFEEKMQSIHLGIEARQFYLSNIGQHLVNKIDQVIVTAMHQLRSADPHDAKEIQRLQNEINVAEMSKLFLFETINDGENAQRDMEEHEVGFDYRTDLSNYSDNFEQGEEE